jgi:hypothetical protein
LAPHLPSGFFPSGFLTKILYALIISSKYTFNLAVDSLPSPDLWMLLK